VEGQGTTGNATAYEYTDASPMSRNNYYRLKQKEFDGEFSYSNIVEIRFAESAKLNVYPNPVSTQLTVELADTRYNGVLTIYNIQGQIVLEKVLNEAPVHQVNVEDLNTGTYMYKLTNGDQVSSGKLTKL
ncbi:MAG: T9SS type A sorting domain-containing protein, partial [Bacteroidota bacterium]